MPLAGFPALLMAACSAQYMYPRLGYQIQCKTLKAIKYGACREICEAAFMSSQKRRLILRWPTPCKSVEISSNTLDSFYVEHWSQSILLYLILIFFQTITLDRSRHLYIVLFYMSIESQLFNRFVYIVCIVLHVFMLFSRECLAYLA